jgi:hypothetical protein
MSGQRFHSCSLTAGRLRQFVQTMKSLPFLLVLFAVCCPATGPAKEKPSNAEAKVDPKIVREILKMERQFDEAIKARDAGTLDRLLADYYADSREGSDTAVSKKGTLARSKAGLLISYPIERQQRVTQSRDSVTVEGLSRNPPDQVTDTEQEEQWLHIRRLWTKKEGRWLLVFQTRKDVEEEKSKEKDEASK